mmetsp:Transcript_8133/g.13378  ORF Transcript_8133/g.13378 Transcript_8133/m.13378 type:complete len:247 (+) Transcript_8133:502-1242(+)
MHVDLGSHKEDRLAGVEENALDTVVLREPKRTLRHALKDMVHSDLGVCNLGVGDTGQVLTLAVPYKVLYRAPVSLLEVDHHKIIVFTFPANHFAAFAQSLVKFGLLVLFAILVHHGSVGIFVIVIGLGSVVLTIWAICGEGSSHELLSGFNIVLRGKGCFADVNQNNVISHSNGHHTVLTLRIPGNTRNEALVHDRFFSLLVVIFVFCALRDLGSNLLSGVLAQVTRHQAAARLHFPDTQDQIIAT